MRCVVIVTAAATRIPEELLQQMAVGGRMVIPVGNPDQSQTLVLVERLPEEFRQTKMEAVKFVPLLGGTS